MKFNSAFKGLKLGYKKEKRNEHNVHGMRRNSGKISVIPKAAEWWEGGYTRQQQR